MTDSFFQQIYQIVGAIPAGSVTTYGTIARMLGRPQSARYVGFALRCAPEGLPCHRVVNRSGTLAPPDVFGAQALQKSLLAAEGIRFLPTGQIDMEKHLWPSV